MRRNHAVRSGRNCATGRVGLLLMAIEIVSPAPAVKFADPDITARGEPRAKVAFTGLKTLWVNTGTLCNIACVHCYIESSPSNDSLSYFTPADLASFLDEVDTLAGGLIEIGFTGGEPFMNPHMDALAEMALARGHSVLILTNAMRPMMRPKQRSALLALRRTYGRRLILRVSLDHYGGDRHDQERGEGGFDETVKGIDWLAAHEFSTSLAGRSMLGECEADARRGYAKLIAAHGWAIDANDPAELVIFPEMDEQIQLLQGKAVARSR